MEIEKMAQEANSAVESHVDSTLNDIETFDDFRYGRPKKMSTEVTSLTSEAATTSSSSLPYTAKGERRLREKLEREGRTPEEVGLASMEDPTLTPEKLKQMEADRRAQWRRERLKSLENVSGYVIASLNIFGQCLYFSYSTHRLTMHTY
jgi:hypothetical protein